MMDQLPADVRERQKMLDELADHDPVAMRAWVERHPRNLMLYTGWEVEAFTAAALNDWLTCQRSFWLAPRGSGKSTAALLFCIWLSLSEPRNRLPVFRDLFKGAPREIGPSNLRVALTSNSAEKAEEAHAQARGILTDERLAKLFGKLDGERWTNRASTTSLRKATLKEGTFTALGLGSKVTGGHYDLVLVDDWVTEDNARTELQRKRLTDFWNMTVKPTHEPWARTIGCGTRYHPSDWYNQVKEWVDDGLWHKLRVTPALLPEAPGPGGEERWRSYWPAVWPVEKLLETQREIGSVAFSTQYQNDIGLMQGDFFRTEWLEHFYTLDKLPRSVREAVLTRTVISLDPAIKAGVRNDFSVFTVLAYAAPNFYVRKVVRGQWTQRELEHIALRLVHKYRAREVAVEVVGGTEFIVQGLRELRGMPRVRVMRPTQFRGKDKTGRADSVRRFFEQGRVWFEEPDKDNGIQRMLDECMAFPTAVNVPGADDCVDSLVWGLLMLSRQRSRLVKMR